MSRDRRVMVLGRRSLLRDAVVALLQTTGYEMVGAAGERYATKVLVSPANQDWDRLPLDGAGAVVVTPRSPSDDELLDLIERGADAVVDASDSPGVLVRAVDAVAAGEPCLSSKQTRAVLERLRNAGSAGRLVLTPREREILTSIAEGESVKQTARRLDISEKTVQNTQGRLFRKLEARNRAQAIARAHERGLL